MILILLHKSHHFLPSEFAVGILSPNMMIGAAKGILAPTSKGYGGGLILPRSNLLGRYGLSTITIGGSTKLMSRQAVVVLPVKSFSTEGVTVKTVGASGCDYTTIQAGLNGLAAGTPGNNNVLLLHADTPGGSKTYNERITSAAGYITIANRPGDKITIDSSGLAGRTIYSSHAGFTLTSTKADNSIGLGGLYVQGATVDENWLVLSGSGEANGVSFISGIRHVRANVNMTITLNGCYFGPTSVLNAGGVMDLNAASANAVFNHCLFSGAYTSPCFYVREGSLTLNNCTMYGVPFSAIYVYPNTRTKVININNSILLACSYSQYTSPVNNSSTSGETVTIKNSLITASARNPSLYPAVSGTYVDGGGNRLTSLPRFVSNKYTSIATIEIDDAANANSVATLLGLVEQYGWKITWNINTLAMTDERWVIARSLVDGGHDITSHSRRHVDVSNLKSFDIRAIAAGVTATIAGGILSMSNGDSFTLANYSTVNDLIAAVSATGHYSTIVVNSTAYAGNSSIASSYAGGASPESLAEVAGVDISSAVYTILQDAAKYRLEEISGSKMDIESNIPGFTVTGFTCPGNYYNEDVAVSARSFGYLSVRSSYGSAVLSSVDLCNISAHNIKSFPETSQSEAENYIAGTLAPFGVVGRVGAFFMHDLLTTPYAYLAEFFELLENSGISVLSRKEMEAYVALNGTTSDGREYVVTESDRLNVRLQPDSVCISSGTAAVSSSDIYDLAGNKVHDGTYGISDGQAIYGVSIGAYQYNHSSPFAYHFDIISGSDWTDLVIKAPLAPELMAADEGTLFTTGVANEIDQTALGGMTGDQFFFSESKGMAIYDADLSGTDLERADRYFGF